MSSQHLMPLEFNEILVIAKKDGQTSYWTAWKRALSAFNDPRMWENIDVWPEYFQRQVGPNLAWGMTGYGIVAIDFDAKKSWSINDYTTPASLFLPMGNVIKSDDDPSDRALMNLLADPIASSQATLSLLPMPSMMGAIQGAITGKKPHKRTRSLDQIVPKGLTPEQSIDWIKKNIAPGLKIDGHSFMVADGQYLPNGWSIFDNLGKSDLDVWVNLIEHAYAHGFDPPHRENLMEYLTTHDFQEYFETEEEFDALVERVEELLNSWPPKKNDAGMGVGKKVKKRSGKKNHP